MLLRRKPVFIVNRCSDTPRVFSRARRTSSEFQMSVNYKLWRILPSVGTYRGEVTRSSASRKLQRDESEIRDHYWKTYKPAISSGLIFSMSINLRMIGSVQSRFMSSAQAFKTTPGSSGSDQSIRSALSQLFRPMSRLNVFFQPTEELTLISC